MRSVELLKHTLQRTSTARAVVKCQQELWLCLQNQASTNKISEDTDIFFFSLCFSNEFHSVHTEESQKSLVLSGMFYIESVLRVMFDREQRSCNVL